MKRKRPETIWSTVKPRKIPNYLEGKVGKAGMAKAASSFKAAVTQVPLLIYNVNKMASTTDICEYITEKTGERTPNLVKIIPRKEKPYDSYKLYLDKDKVDVFLDPHLWPDQIKFRKYIYFKKKELGKGGGARLEDPAVNRDLPIPNP